MIKIFKSNLSRYIYVEGVCSGPSDDFEFSFNGEYCSIYKKYSGSIEVDNLHYSKFQGVNSVTKEPISFNSSQELNDYLTFELKNEEILNIDHITKLNPHSEYYIPTFIVHGVSTDFIEINSTKTIILKGLFLDHISDISFIGSIDGTGSVNIISQNEKQIILELTASLTVQYYDLILKSKTQTETITILGTNPIFITPDNNVLEPFLWVKQGNKNSTSLALGVFEAKNNNGNGWNEHAYFGPLTTGNVLEFEFICERLYGTSGAYCFIRFNNDNSASTQGFPKLYIENGYTLKIYNSEGIITTANINKNDFIKTKLSNNSMQVFINGKEVMKHLGNYNLENIYPTFIAYRVFKANNIKAIIY